MHPNPAFRKASRDQNIEFARARSFGILSINGERAPLHSHVPFQLSDDGCHLEAHLVRSNPIVRALDHPVDAVMVVSGADAYVSPDWYGIDNQVPTWNYVAVHLRGRLERLEMDRLPAILDRLSAAMEARLLPKAPWKTGKMDPDIYAKMRRQIVPVAMRVEAIDGTWKLSQNKPEEAIAGAALGIAGQGIGIEPMHLAEAMRQKGGKSDP